MDLLSAGDGGSRSWHSLLWHQWVAALRAEAAALAHDPRRSPPTRQSQSARRSQPDRAPSPQGAEALLRVRTLILARNSARATGAGELARMGATPMAAYR